MFKPSSVLTPEGYLSKIDEPRRSEVEKIHNFIIKNAPKLTPYIEYGMIGYGKSKYKTKAGKEGTWFVIGLANQKNYISVYCCVTKDGEYLAEKYKDILGKTSVGKSCIRYKKIEDIDWKGLEKVLKESQEISLNDGIFGQGN